MTNPRSFPLKTVHDIGAPIRTIPIRATLTLAVLWAMLAPSGLLAQVSVWNRPGQPGNWEDPNNWNNGVPSSSRDANITTFFSRITFTDAFPRVNNLTLGNSTQVEFAKSSALAQANLLVRGNLTGNDALLRLTSGVNVSVAQDASIFNLVVQNGSRFNANGRLTPRGILQVQAGGNVSAFDLDATGSFQIDGNLEARNNLAILNAPTGQEATVYSGGSVTTDGQLSVGGGTLQRFHRNLFVDGTIRSGSTRISNQGSIIIRDGTLDTDSLFLEGSGELDFRGGTLRIRGDHTTLNSYALNGSSLNVDGHLRINRNLDLGGGSVNAGSLTVENATVTGGTLRAPGSGVLNANNAQIETISTAGDVVENNGLVIGTLRSAFHFSGDLIVNDQVVLLESNDVWLGFNTTLNEGGKLQSVNGIRLLSGRQLTAHGDNVIDGMFVNDGDVDGGNGLTFVDDVTGSGNFTGNVIFSDGYSPGNSPGLVLFDNVIFDDTSELEIELGGLLAGTEFDQLQISGDATLDGLLNVDLINGFTLDESQTFKILDVAGTLSGQFLGLGENDLVGNFGGQDLFITYQAGDGNDVALFTAVPEPSSVMVLLFGGSVILVRRRTTRSRV